MKRPQSTILVIDDDGDDLVLAEAAFKAIGVGSTIHFLRGGIEAIAYLSGSEKYKDRDLFHLPDFVLTDLKMPGVDGFDLLRYMRLNPQFATIPTAVFSGSQDSDDIQKAYQLGANAYHIKPSGTMELRELLRIIYSYWMKCEVPSAELREEKAELDRRFKMGARALESTAPWFAKSIAQITPEPDRLSTAR